MSFDKNRESSSLTISKVTVGLPTFNRLDLLKRAVESLLIQRYPSLEIIISDNASSDGTQEYLRGIKDPRVKVLLNAENIGMVRNWDQCLRAASGSYFLLMSDDDALIGDGALDKFVSGFFEGVAENIAFVFSDVLLERANGSVVATSAKKISYESSDLIADFFSNKISVYPCATFFRTTDLLDFGGYGSFGASLAVDACAWISIALRYGTVVRVAETLSIYRIHQSLSSSPVEMWDKDMKIMHSILKHNEKNIPKDKFCKIERAVEKASDRIPLAYIVRNAKYVDEYRLRSIFIDVYLWRSRLFSLNNFAFALNRLFVRLCQKI